ncbi:MAG: peptide ABC transporter substrate-binding protein [Chloroflexia bacterium]|nr:peptide ABC transporter substrate-binding protein [Chloroflexia bacterium]
MKRQAVGLLYLLLLALLLGACDLEVSTATAPTPADGDVLTLTGGSYDPPTLDPALANDANSTFVIRQIFSGLVSLNDDLQIIPDLAADWSVSADGRVYTFTLRPEARFNSGRPVRAEDVIYSFERACDPALGPNLPCGTYLNDIVGVTDKLAGQADSIAGLRAVGQDTVVITIDAPKSYFLSKLTYNTAYLVDRDNVASGRDWTEQPNGTGPFYLAEWQHDRRMVLARNEQYYLDPPQLAQVVILLGAEASNPLLLYEQGQIGFTEVGTSVVARLEYEGSPLAQELRVSPELSLSYVGFNSSMPPFDDPKVRQALTMAVDREKIARVTFEGRLQQAEGILPPGMPGYDPDVSGLPYDPEQARQLLAESRYGGAANMPRITLYTSGGGIAALLQQVYREELGLEIELRQIEWADFLLGLDERRYQMYSLSWMADYADPQNFLEVIFHSSSPNNHGAYHNPEVDRLLEEAAVEQDIERRFELYRQAERLIIHDAPVIPLNHGVSYSLTKPYVQGLQVTPMGLQNLSNIWIKGR